MSKSLTCYCRNLFLVTVLTVASAWAETESPALPKVSLTAAGEIEFIYSEDRVVVLAYREAFYSDIKADAKLKMDTCSDKIPPTTCRLNLSVHRYEIVPIWRKNPDPSRLGQVIKIYDSEFSSGALFSDWFEKFRLNKSDFHKIYSETYSQLQGPIWSCDNEEWLHSKDGRIEQMSFETMQESPETGLNENQTLLSYLNLQFTKTPLGLQLTDLQKFHRTDVRNFNPNAQSLQAQRVGFTTRSSEKSCDMYFDFAFDPLSLQKFFNDKGSTRVMKVESLSTFVNNFVTEYGGLLSYRVPGGLQNANSLSAEEKLLVSLQLANINTQGDSNAKFVLYGAEIK